MSDPKRSSSLSVKPQNTEIKQEQCHSAAAPHSPSPPSVRPSVRPVMKNNAQVSVWVCIVVQKYNLRNKQTTRTRKKKLNPHVDCLETLQRLYNPSPQTRRMSFLVVFFFFSFFFFSVCLTHTDTIPRSFMSTAVNPAGVCSSPINSWLSRQAFRRQESRLEAPSVRPSVRPSGLVHFFVFCFIFCQRILTVCGESSAFRSQNQKSDDSVNTEPGEINKQSKNKTEK